MRVNMGWGGLGGWRGGGGWHGSCEWEGVDDGSERISGYMGISAIGGSGTDLSSLIEEMRAEMIERLDRNGDGGIDEEEVGEVAETFGEKVTAWFEKSDGDQSRTLDEAEVLGGIESLDESLIDRARQLIFAQLDRDGDGEIDEDEVSAAVEELDEKIAGLFDAHDLDRDGVLSAEEIDEALNELLPEPPPPPPPSESAEELEEGGELGANALLSMLNATDSGEEVEGEGGGTGVEAVGQ